MIGGYHFLFVNVNIRVTYRCMPTGYVCYIMLAILSAAFS